MERWLERVQEARNGWIHEQNLDDQSSWDREVATGSKRLFAWLLWDFNESFQVEEEWKKKMIPLHIQKDEADAMQMTAWRLEV